MRYVIGDMEATGLDLHRQMIELALLNWDGERTTEVFETLINPLSLLSSRVQELTGIRLRELETAPKFYEIADKVAGMLNGATFVSHNVAFDWPMLEKEFVAMGIAIKCKTLCTLKMAQELVPGLKSYTLEDLCKFFHIKIRPSHRALPDAEATLALFLELQELAHPPRGKVIDRYLPQHQAALKKIPSQSGILRFQDAKGVVVLTKAAEDLSLAAHEALRVRPEAKKLLESCETVEYEITGSPLIAAFKEARFHPAQHEWMIREATEADGWRYLQALPGRKGALWNFSNRSEAQRALKMMEQKLPLSSFAWREGGRSKEEILDHNRALDVLLRETRFPAENLLLWGPGRHADEWSYVLVRAGKLQGWGYDERPPEKVVENPESAIQQRGSARDEKLAVRYLREHRQKRLKKDQWRELKEVRC